LNDDSIRNLNYIIDKEFVKDNNYSTVTETLDNEFNNNSCNEIWMKTTKNKMESENEGKNECSFVYTNRPFFGYDCVIGIEPSGWTYKEPLSGTKFSKRNLNENNNEKKDVSFQNNNENIKKDEFDFLTSSSFSEHKWGNDVKTYGFPYSEHSSFTELLSFILFYYFALDYYFLMMK
jgi:hypothetical protein